MDSKVIIEVKPVDVTAVFGLGPTQSNSKLLLTTFLDLKMAKKEGDVWFLKMKDKDDNDVFPSVRVAENAMVLLGSLKAKDHTVVFDGHSNHGIGPWFDVQGGPATISISDFTNLAGVNTWIPSSQCTANLAFVDYTGNDHPDVSILTADFPLTPTNYLVPVLLEARFDNDDGVAPGAQPMVPGQAFTRTLNLNDSKIFHYQKGGTKRAIVKAGKADLPALKYKHFFYNVCFSGRDYTENFQHETFFYTKQACNIESATKIFVEEFLKKSTPADIVTELNQSGAGGGNDIYGYKNFNAP